jgi:hypothetical protein
MKSKKPVYVNAKMHAKRKTESKRLIIAFLGTVMLYSFRYYTSIFGFVEEALTVVCH